ncbi:hypothetical protein [Gordonia insulae]|uniref:Uncharacterized protein n=1 Tax=Gordonia insulae TaxID=2420509 RepID=A0A3G8JLI7_9ACTN|nr:hypothetical protein [Gordonia insulae]AZG45883.1 hypothetical protein D7316_02483 [Gordonia insulae]
MEEHIEQLPEDDWVDQDLLTRELASELLDEEITAETERLGDSDADGELFSRADRERRIAAMVAVRDRHRDPDIARVRGVKHPISDAAPSDSDSAR